MKYNSEISSSKLKNSTQKKSASYEADNFRKIRKITQQS